MHNRPRPPITESVHSMLHTCVEQRNELSRLSPRETIIALTTIQAFLRQFLASHHGYMIVTSKNPHFNLDQRLIMTASYSALSSKLNLIIDALHEHAKQLPQTISASTTHRHGFFDANASVHSHGSQRPVIVSPVAIRPHEQSLTSQSTHASTTPY